MAKASSARQTDDATGGTINPGEVAHFGKLATDWWDPEGSSAMLHRLNPIRLGYIRFVIDRHFDADPAGMRPLAGRRALDVGCGAGLVCEPLARLGAEVTGVDAAPENIDAAKSHAEAAGLTIDYRCGGIEHLAAGPFDLVTALEVIEHVDNPRAFVGGLARALAPDGVLILSTPNRTALSRLLLVEGAERAGWVPRGTHDWHKFVTPEELSELLAEQGLAVIDSTGIGFTPTRGFRLSDNKVMSYLVAAGWS